MDTNHFDSRSFHKTRKVEMNGFIADVDRDLRKFYHAEQRSVALTYVLAVCLGMFGAHHFYLGRTTYGIMYLCTLGLFGVGYLVDLIRVPSLVKDANIRRIDEEEERTMSDLYVLWFPCGILGFHHFYLRNPLLGVLYLLTGGMWGLGWIIDGIQLSGIVLQYNHKEVPSVSILYAYLFMLPPFGILGFHHYYCKRTYWGILYSLTLGCFLLGWIVDFIRVPFLVSRTEGTDGDGPKKYYSDDAYILWLSFGLLGFHHFYLKRYRWGLVYALTLGLFGIGWIVDAYRIPYLVKQLNVQSDEEEDITNVVSNFHKRRGSFLSGARKEDNYTRFDDVMQNQRPEGSPKIFTVHRSNSIKRIVPDQSFDDVTTDEDRDENELYTYNAGQLRRTISSYSNNTHTVAVDVHTCPGQHLANPPYSEESRNMTPVLRSKQAKRSSEQKKRIQTNATEMEISQQPRDIDGGYAKKESESNGVIYHELPSETTNADTDSNLRQKHSTEEKVKVRTKTKRKIIVSQSMKTKQPTKDNATFNSPAKLSKENNEATNIEKDQKTDVFVQARESPIGDDLNKDVYSVEKSKDPRKLDKDQRIDDNRSELDSNSVATVARSYSTISQRSSSQSNVMENSMTSIDVNKMSIPILNDDYTMTNSNPNTPRSARESTPRFDPDPNNSLPRVIKVRKNKSMAQTKRNIRRSIKRSRQRAQTSEKPEEEYKNQDTPLGGAVEKAVADHGR